MAVLTVADLLPAARITQPPPGTRNQQEHRVASLLARQAQPPQLQQGVRRTHVEQRVPCMLQDVRF